MALGHLPRPFLVDVNGSPRVGAKLYVYQSGTTTPITVYTTNSYTTAHDSPIRGCSRPSTSMRRPMPPIRWW
jgi:hypothetical protein